MGRNSPAATSWRSCIRNRETGPLPARQEPSAICGIGAGARRPGCSASIASGTASRRRSLHPSSLNSRGTRSSTRGPRPATRPKRSSTRASQRSEVCSRSGGRRASTSTLARSSAVANGFDRSSWPPPAARGRVVDARRGAQHEHRRPDTRGAQPVEQREPIHPGQQAIERMTSKLSVCARRSPPGPVISQSAANPAEVKSSAISAAVSPSSSITRTLIMGACLHGPHTSCDGSRMQGSHPRGLGIRSAAAL
jgi:hypothetical protein